MKIRSIFSKKFCIMLVFAFCVAGVFAVPLNQLYIMANDGTFLGTFENEYSQKSIYNRYGSYGSPYSSTSIFNKYSSYGSDYSQYSPFNNYASNAPYLMDKNGNYYGCLSTNKYARGVTDFSYRLALQLKALRDSM